MVNTSFASPQSRLQLSILLLNFFQSHPALPIRDLAESKLFQTMLLCLQVDNSTSLFALLVHCLNIILPSLTVCEVEKARQALPRMLAILGRALCWRKRAVEKGADKDREGRIPEWPVSYVEQNASYADKNVLHTNVDWVTLGSRTTFPLCANKKFTLFHFISRINVRRPRTGDRTWSSLSSWS